MTKLVTLGFFLVAFLLRMGKIEGYKGGFYFSRITGWLLEHDQGQL